MATEKSAKKAPAKKTKAPATKAARRPVRTASPADLGPIQKMILASRRDGTPKFWLMKSEPDVFSIDDLKRDGETTWEGVRNYTARNFMRDGMSLGDLVLYYHSNAEPPGIVGVGRISGLAEPDPSQFDPESPYYDEDAKPQEPRWLMVRLAFVEKFPERLPRSAQGRSSARQHAGRAEGPAPLGAAGGEGQLRSGPRAGSSGLSVRAARSPAGRAALPHRSWCRRPR